MTKMMDRGSFERSLENPLAFWKGRSKEEICDLLGTDVGAMVGFDQRNPHHCYDLFLHTLHTVAGLPDSSSSLLRAAAFFHDIGKVKVAREKNGRLVFYGHPQISAEISDPILTELGYSRAERERILFYISHHDDFITWCLPEDIEENDGTKYYTVINKKNVLRQIRKMENEAPFLFRNKDGKEIWSELISLLEADAVAQADAVIINDVIMDTKEHKLKKTRRIKSYLI